MTKLLIACLRISICGLALWFVIRSVSLNDRITLKGDGRSLTGRVTTHDDGFIVRLPRGETRVLAPTDVATDENGAPRIAYGLLSGWQHSRKQFLLAAALAFMIVPLLQAQRLRCLLMVESIRVGYWDALKISFAGNFLNFAAPLGSTAGDVFKAFYLSLHTSRRTEAMTIVFLDRVVGLGTLLLVVSLITMTSAADGRMAPLRMYLLGMTAAGAFGQFLYLLPPLRRTRLWSRIIQRLPMSAHLQRIDHTALRLAGRKSVLGAAILTTVVLQVFAALSFFFVAIAMGLVANAASATEYFAYFSTGELVKALPGPPQGLGTMELAYGYLFAPFGSSSQILCAAFAIRIVTLLCSLPGALVTLTGSYRPSSVAPEHTIGGPVLRAE